MPYRFQMPWWVVLVVLMGTAVLSVAYSEGVESIGEEGMTGETALDSGTDQSPSSEAESLVTLLQQRLQDLKKREQGLLEKQTRLERLQNDLNNLAARQAKEAEQVQARSRALEAEKEKWKALDPSRLRIIKVYEAMDPEEAAIRIEKMKEGLALDILAGIKEKTAAAVLAGIKPKKAAQLSVGLRHYRERKLKKE